MTNDSGGKVLSEPNDDQRETKNRRDPMSPTAGIETTVATLYSGRTLALCNERAQGNDERDYLRKKERRRRRSAVAREAGTRAPASGEGGRSVNRANSSVWSCR